MTDVMVSVIIPAYNVENYVSAAIESCINQTYRNIEIVIIDDGSTDDTLSVIKRYATLDDRINYQTQINQGVSAARNNALSLAKGKYVLFLDSDDWLEVDAVEKLVHLSTQYTNRLICVDCYFAKYEGNNLIREQQGLNFELSILTLEEALLTIGEANNGYRLQSSCYKLFDREVLKANNIIFDKEIHNGEDGLFTFTYLNKMIGLVYEPLSLWNILERPGSATTAPYNSRKITAIHAVKKMIELSNNGTKVLNNLHHFMLERSLALAFDFIKSGSTELTDYTYLKKIIKDNIKYMIVKQFTIKRILQYIFILCIPLKLQRLVFSILKK